jgi:hypothetical protein
MNNFNTDQKVPLWPSIAVTVCLQPWFETDVLEKDLASLRETDLSHFFFHRHTACAVFKANAPHDRNTSGFHHKEFAVTPSLQYIKDPALNQEKQSLWAYGLRVRIAL